MKVLKFLPKLIVILLAVFILGLGIAQASTKEELDKKIKELQAKITELQGQEKTLSSQIQAMDGQIALTELQIQSTKQQILDLNLDIDTTNKKISNIEGSLNNLTKVLINRVKATYEVGSAPGLQALLISNDINDFVRRANYLRIAQAHDKRLIYDTVQAKNDYQNQREIFEDKKDRVEALSAQLESYSAQLEKEKREKDALLAITKNNEATFQAQLRAALAEQRAIQGIIAGQGTENLIRSVGEGETIGSYLYGNSPCSYGSHLHFEVIDNGVRQNPSNYLSQKGVSWQNSPDGQFGFSGSWQWPINDPISISQGYGHTYYSSIYYGGGPHTGIDMYSNSSSSIKAVKSGNLYRGSIGGCTNPVSGPLPYLKLIHEDGKQTLYLHSTSSL